MPQQFGGKYGGRPGSRQHGGRLTAADATAAGRAAVSSAAISGSKLGSGRCHGKFLGNSPTAVGATASSLAAGSTKK